MGYVEPARQFALEKASNEWILVVDADELVPFKLKNNIVEIAEQDMADVVYIPRNNYFFGKLLRGTGWGPLQDVQPRFFKKSFMSFSPAIHSIFQIKDGARIYYIKDPEAGFIHFSYIDVDHFLDKLNRYTTIEAKNMYKGVKEPLTLKKLLIKIFKTLIGRFIARKGYKDSIYGFSLTILMLAYHTSAYLKYKIMEKFETDNPRDKILLEYKRIAEKIIEEYK
ncbi:glycosyl transferase, family 2 [Thermodesulfovibrio sp. N1]|nr:glycosyl transferase, family 2 [Thermodesulfovibrio sp. N1]